MSERFVEQQIYQCPACERIGRWRCCYCDGNSNENPLVSVRLIFREIVEGERDPHANPERGDMFLSPYSDTVHGGRRLYYVKSVTRFQGQKQLWVSFDTSDGAGCTATKLYDSLMPNADLVERMERIEAVA